MHRMCFSKLQIVLTDYDKYFVLSGRPEIQSLLATFCEMPEILDFQSIWHFIFSKSANQNSIPTKYVLTE